MEVVGEAGGEGCGGAIKETKKLAMSNLNYIFPFFIAEDLAASVAFYVDRLGFEATARLGSQALFVSAGGYHHHMAMNTWSSRGAGPRTLALGLGQVEIRVPGADDLGELSERMRHYGIEARDDGRSVSFDDPWANVVRAVAVA